MLPKMWPLPELMARYEEHRNKQQEAGVRMMAYSAPCCGFDMHTPRPPAGETWSILTQCPACGQPFHRSESFNCVATALPSDENEISPVRRARRKRKKKE